MNERFKIVWLDSGKEPRCASNPDYPHGIEPDLSSGASKTCTVMLPYPAKRVGAYSIECQTCGLRVGITTAGRPDDPRSVKLACK